MVASLGYQWSGSTYWANEIINRDAIIKRDLRKLYGSHGIIGCFFIKRKKETIQPKGSALTIPTCSCLIGEKKRRREIT